MLTEGRVCVCVYWAVVMIAELTVKPREAEHADLVSDVVPGSRRPQTLELFLQLSPHQQNPVSHGLYIVLPAAKHKHHIRSSLGAGALM